MASEICVQQPLPSSSLSRYLDSSVNTHTVPSEFENSRSEQVLNLDELNEKNRLQGLLLAISLKMSGNSGDTLFLSGGLQQYLIKTRSALPMEDEQPKKGFGSDTLTFHDLSDGVQLHILSFLEAEDLCNIASVCKHWLLLSSDNLLWKKKLEKDLTMWKVIGNNTNPDVYQECNADFTAKDMYLRCSPRVREKMKQVGMHQLTQFVVSTVRSFLPKKIPKLAMFGPGLESSTSSIVKKILEGQTDIFKTTGMFPGQFGGIGSGFTIQMKGSSTFNLVTLYTSTWEERQNKPYKDRLKINKLLVQNKNSDLEEDNDIFEVNPSVKDLCRTLDGFVFVIDASNTDETAMSVARSELLSMVNDSWCAPGAPLLVLSCLMKDDSRQMSCIEVVRQLKLSKLNRPWQVHDCVVDSMSGIPTAIDWVIERAQRS